MDMKTIKTVYGVGYNSEGRHNTSIHNNHTHKYKTWHDMIRRCYSEKFHAHHHSYKDCLVCEEWHDFQNFGDWYDENYYEIENEQMHLDKDILIKGNKVYSPDTCIFTPRRINVLFVKKGSKNNNLPIGVVFNNRKNKKYVARCGNGEGKTVSINSFYTPEEAFYCYKKFKELLIRDVANEYKHKIPEKLYNAMITYEVEITD
jgi:hypothetical protein